VVEPHAVLGAGELDRGPDRGGLRCPKVPPPRHRYHHQSCPGPRPAHRDPGAGLFRGLFVLQSVFRALTGQESTIAIVASTLAIVALFVPLRRRVQSFVDHRFYRRKYDAAKTLPSFSVRLRQETDLGMLSDDLVRVVSETLQPAPASLWLRPEVPPRDEQADLP
jgi:hypothetical protein